LNDSRWLSDCFAGLWLNRPRIIIQQVRGRLIDGRWLSDYFAGLWLNRPRIIVKQVQPGLNDGRFEFVEHRITGNCLDFAI